MFFRKKNPAPSGLSGNVRRRFHHFLLQKRKLAPPAYPSQRATAGLRHKRKSNFFQSPAYLRLRKLFWGLAACGIFLGLTYTVFFSSFFTVTKISLEKNGKAVGSASLSPFLDRVRGKNILFLSPEKLEREIEQTFKNEVLLVKIKKSFPHRLVVKVEEYPAMLNLRVQAGDKTQKLILNQIGYAIFENAEEKELATLRVETQKPFPPKSIVIDKEKMADFSMAFQRFRELFGMKVTEGFWRKTERELHLKTEKNFLVWLDLTAPIEPQLSKLKRALPKLDIYRTPLEYIDLRIAGGESEKVIFKRR